MTQGIKISVIGAGSGEFSLGIVRDLCLTEGLAGTTVSFMDIDAERLAAIHSVASQYTAEVGADIRFEKTLDRRESLVGADFVINTAMVGGWRGWQRSGAQEILRKYGYTRRLRLGSFHQFKLFMDIIHDVEALCPDAWYVQSANPVFDGITLITRESNIKAVGLCHGYLGVYELAKTIGLEPAQVEWQAYGINHFIWLQKFTCAGQDAYPILDDWIENEAEAYWASEACDISDHQGRKAVDVYKRLGRYPIGDTVTPGGGSKFGVYHASEEVAKRWQEDPRGWMERHIEHVFATVETFKAVAADPTRKVTDVYPVVRTNETNVAIIDAIVNDKPTVFQVNIPNRGCIPGVADDVAVEVPALVSAAGIQGLHVGDLPRPIMVHMMDMIQRMERNVQTFQSRDRGMLLDMLLIHPDARSPEDTKACLEELLALPFNVDMAEWYSPDVRGR
jgi:alpha-galactosidase